MRRYDKQYDRVSNNFESKSQSAKDPYLPFITLNITSKELKLRNKRDILIQIMLIN